MSLGDPRDVFFTFEMKRFMGNPYAMRFARKILFDAKPLLAYADLSDEWIIRELATTDSQQISRKVTLYFDGSFLTWRDVADGKIVRHSWSAVSGRPGHQTKEHQSEADKGPIPAGKWIVQQSKYQSAKNRSLWEKAKNAIGFGKWPGGESSWGQHRIWLVPEKGTETHGRSGFSIHGGSTPGSAGCIDLTDKIEEFVEMFLEYGKDVELEVEYP